MSESLHETVGEMLVSETFTADELVPVLTSRGHDEAAVRAAIADVVAAQAREAEDPTRLARIARHKRAAHLVRLGAFWLVIGLPAIWFTARGIVPLLLVFAIGATIFVAGLRGLRR